MEAVPAPVHELVLQGVQQHRPSMVPGGAVDQVGDSGVNAGNDLGSLSSQEMRDVALGAQSRDAIKDLQAVVPIEMLPFNSRGRPRLGRRHVGTVGLRLLVVVDTEI